MDRLFWILVAALIVSILMAIVFACRKKPGVLGMVLSFLMMISCVVALMLVADKMHDERENELTEFDSVLLSVGIDPKDAKDMEQIDDWAQGERYRFDTHGTTAYVYYLMDGTVESVRIGSDLHFLYKRGYEPWDIENFIVEDSMQSVLMYCSEEVVSSCLKYPAEAQFPIMDWSFDREFDVYSVRSYVTAKNAFGVKDKLQFYVKFLDDGENFRMVYLLLDGDIVLDETELIPEQVRETVSTGETEATGSDGEIRIVDGELGEFGEAVKLDDWDYIWYHIPAGTYTVSCNSKCCNVYVDRNTITRNSEGYVEMENVQTLELAYGESGEITVAEDEHLFLTVYADITLKNKE